MLASTISLPFPIRIPLGNNSERYATAPDAPLQTQPQIPLTYSLSYPILAPIGSVELHLHSVLSPHDAAACPRTKHYNYFISRDRDTYLGNIQTQSSSSLVVLLLLLERGSFYLIYTPRFVEGDFYDS